MGHRQDVAVIRRAQPNKCLVVRPLSIPVQLTGGALLVSYEDDSRAPQLLSDGICIGDY